MKNKWLKVITIIIGTTIVAATLKHPHPLAIATAKASPKVIQTESHIYSSANAFINQYNKNSKLGPIESYTILKKSGVIKLQASLGGYGSMTAVMNVDKSLRNIVYQQKYMYYPQETLDDMKKNGIEGDGGVEIALTIETLLSIFSPDATIKEHQEVTALFDHTPRLDPKQASWRTAKIGNITYSLHMSEEGMCSFKVSRQVAN
ncbi:MULTISPECIES: hypothetical protein [Paenibacillus]|uniref:Uncharacterized protein n=2 Tax=Paenibacillus TaxID=44249 RepID=A0A089M7U1_9BACL|nr:MULTISPECIES: hypothetical protein [Paenibacillus]AIQ67583.1 hypothetical protein PGRAT_07980 [Paenibacillus graminis]KWX72352.1 hypothetical protein AML91_21265 [Paenibacillus jilunlii]SDL65884.1 hypothetical protein SAMN05216191_104263 [Paenibacillus jilunlii]